MRWRHPWWLLANRWRALAGNLTGTGLLRLYPRLLRGELRAARTVLRWNWRAAPVVGSWWCVAPALIVHAWRRWTPGARLQRLPMGER
jgi:hypothetical protein